MGTAKPSPDDEMRRQMVDEELTRIVQEAEQSELEEEFEPEALEALKIAANKIAYIKKYYNVMKDEMISFPTVTKTIIDYTLFDEAEKYYFDEEDEFPQEYQVAIRAVVFDQMMEKKSEESDDAVYEDAVYAEMMERLASNEDEVKGEKGAETDEEEAEEQFKSALVKAYPDTIVNTVEDSRRESTVSWKYKVDFSDANVTVEEGEAEKKVELSLEAQMRKRMIDEELDGIIHDAIIGLEEELEPEALDALKIAADNIAYRKKYYDVMKDKIIYFPTVSKTIVDHSLFDEAEKFYFGDEDSFPMDYSLEIRNVVFERMEGETDDENDDAFNGQKSKVNYSLPQKKMRIQK